MVTLVHDVCMANSSKFFSIESKKDLKADINSDTNGHFRDGLLAPCKTSRTEDCNVNAELEDKDPRELYEGGEKRKGTDCFVFINILNSRRAPQEATFGQL
ncbi:annexin A1-like [Silurus meridionalis]|uniref:annexin A1-like n=1 Tax=Silurus meridionalis TaxID=175797 RepID=UPI001EE9FD97|nr:annexin A1-like [Silurus meridionalis]